MPSTRTYSISLDMPGGVLNNPGRLQSELAVPGNGITTKLVGVSTGGGDVLVTFDATLSGPEILALDGGTGAPYGTHPAGGLLAAHNDSPSPPVPSLVEVSNQPRVRDDGVIYAVPKPSSFGLVMCDRDMRIRTCLVDPTASVEDLKINTQTNLEESWGELSLVGVYKLVGGAVVACVDQTDADANGVLTMWDYGARMGGAGGAPILYELRDGLLYVDPTLPANELWRHRAYAVVAPSIPAFMGGSVVVFDAYLAVNPDNLVAALSPQATVLDPAGPGGPGGAVLRLYIYHPAGSKLSHVLRLVSYRAPGTF